MFGILLFKGKGVGALIFLNLSMIGRWKVWKGFFYVYMG